VVQNIVPAYLSHHPPYWSRFLGHSAVALLCLGPPWLPWHHGSSWQGPEPNWISLRKPRACPSGCTVVTRDRRMKFLEKTMPTHIHIIVLSFFTLCIFSYTLFLPIDSLLHLSHYTHLLLVISSLSPILQQWVQCLQWQIRWVFCQTHLI